MSAAEDQCLQDQQPVEKKTGKYFYREYSVRVEQKDYVQEVRRLAGEYNRYIRLKLDGDDGAAAAMIFSAIVIPISYSSSRFREAIRPP